MQQMPIGPGPALPVIMPEPENVLVLPQPQQPLPPIRRQTRPDFEGLRRQLRATFDTVEDSTVKLDQARYDREQNRGSEGEQAGRVQFIRNMEDFYSENNLNDPWA